MNVAMGLNSDELTSQSGKLMKIVKKINNKHDYKELLNKLDALQDNKSNNGVYFFQNRFETLYIGHSTNIYQRLYAHQYFIESLLESNKLTQISIKLFESEEDGRNFERISIYKWKPLYNLAYTNSRVRMYDYIPFSTRLAIKDHFNANKDKYNDQGELIEEMVNHYFQNNKQLKIA